jgi:hypothetical protein
MSTSTGTRPGVGGAGPLSTGGAGPLSTGGAGPLSTGGATGLTPATGTGAAKGGAGNSGGATGVTGGAVGRGGNPGTAPTSGKALSCTDPVYGAVSIPAANFISDFETNTLLPIAQDGRGVGADPWHAYAKGDTNDANGEMATPGPANPKYSSNIFKVDSTVPGPCSTSGSLHVKSPGGGTVGDKDFWGVGFGIDFMARTAARKKQTYDASKYTGIGFWAKCSQDLRFAYMKVVDGAQDADIASPTCSYSGTALCNQYGIKNSVITKDWTYYKLYFNELLQDPDSSGFGKGIDPAKLTAFQIHVNQNSKRDGQVSANPFECWVDDVHFLSEAAPKVPAATVEYSTTSNVIKRNGANYVIRGLVRPSMEWDRSGVGITREDVQRMKKWKPNAIRLAVIETFWTDAQDAANAKGLAYQRNVKRVVSWILEEGMDVILDLHHVAGTPGQAHQDFWNAVSKDAFFRDGRIIYELYNEPTASTDALKPWMQATVNLIRANGAKNLVLVSGTDYTFDISGYVSNKVTDAAVAYVTHPYIFKDGSNDPKPYITPAASLPVIATEFGDANIDSHSISPTQCVASVYSDYIAKFNKANMSWTSWAWIVDEWGCGFPQIIADYSGTPNTIGQPVFDALTK